MISVNLTRITIGRMFKQVSLIRIYVLAFLFKEVYDCIDKFGPCEPVRRPGLAGQKPSTQFVFTLSARVEVIETVFDTVIDTLVITALEMQILIIMIATPDSTVKMTVTAKKHRAGDYLVTITNQCDQYLIPYSLAKVMEESGI